MSMQVQTSRSCKVTSSTATYPMWACCCSQTRQGPLHNTACREDVASHDLVTVWQHCSSERVCASVCVCVCVCVCVHVCVCPQCWDKALVSQASAKVESELPPGSVVIEYTGALRRCKRLTLITVCEVPVSWNAQQRMHVWQAA